MLPLNMYSHIASLEQIDAARNFHDETSAKKKEKKEEEKTHTQRGHRQVHHEPLPTRPTGSHP